MPKGQLSRVPWPGNLDAVHFPACCLGALAAPQTFTFTQPATDPELAHHYIQYALSTLSFFLWGGRGCFVLFVLSVERFLQSTVQPHQSTEMALERATSHIKVTHPPCLFQLPPWENVNSWLKIELHEVCSG